MFKFTKLPRKQIIMYLAIALVFVFAMRCLGDKPMSMYKPRRKLRYTAKPMNGASLEEAGAPGVMGLDIDSVDAMYAPAEAMASNNDLQTSCAAANGVGLASSLLPREAASSDNFGEFAPDDILKGQSFLQPRDQIGMPETIGGALRNANQQIRAEPPNPKKPYVWQNSTIAPDTMQRPLV